MNANILKALLRAVAVCICASALATMAFGQEAAGAGQLTGTLKKIKDSKTITIGYRDASIPFSYLNQARRPIGYSIDICLVIVEEVRGELSDDTIQVKYLPVNPQNRIQMIASGAVDLECGSTTNNPERRKQVAFSPVIFVSGTKVMVKQSSRFKSYRDLKGRSIVVTEGTTNEAVIKSINAKEKLDMQIEIARDHDQAFAALQSGKVDAWATDDVLLYAAAKESKNPDDYVVLDQYLSYDPYGIMYRKNDPAFDALVKHTFENLASTRELARIYEQWFLRPLPSGRRLGIAMSPQLESIFQAMGQATE